MNIFYKALLLLLIVTISILIINKYKYKQIIEKLDNCDKVCVNKKNISKLTENFDDLNSQFIQTGSLLNEQTSMNRDQKNRIEFINQEFTKRKEKVDKLKSNINEQIKQTNNISFE